MTKFAAFDAMDDAWKIARLSPLRISNFPEQATMRRKTGLPA